MLPSSPVHALRILAWNCHHGPLSTRVAELAALSPTIVFLQECRPDDASIASFVTQRVNTRKGIALGSLNKDYRLARLRLRPNRGRAVVAATVTGPVSFTALGIWSQGPRYVDDVMRTLKAYDRVLRSGPAVVMGDLNSGTNLAGRRSINKGHARLLGALSDHGLVSAYHAFHQVEHGREHHPTYHHQRNPNKPWHIDYCFVPSNWDLVDVEVVDGKEWTARSDHLPLKVDVQSAPSRAPRANFPSESRL
jgi:exodeoxyribonuclease III